MEGFGKLRNGWDQCLASYLAEQSETEAQIGAIRDSTKEKGGTAPEGFLSSFKGLVGRGVAGLKSKKQIWDLERKLSSSKKHVVAEAARTRDQLLEIALALDVNANAKAELAGLPASSKALNELREMVAAAIEDLERAAGAQDDASNIKSDASAWQANDAMSQVSRSLDPLLSRLAKPPPGLGRGEWSQLHSGEFTTSSLNAFAFNMAGNGHWYNSEVAQSLREAVRKLQALDHNIGVALKSIVDRRASLRRDAMNTASSADAEFDEMHEAVGRWL